jgi:hypothetical protein
LLKPAQKRKGSRRRTGAFLSLSKTMKKAGADPQIESSWLTSPGQNSQELSSVHVILERFASIDEHNRHFVVVLLSQLRVCIDIHFVPLKIGLSPQLRECLLDHITQVASLARIHYNVMHVAIVTANLKKRRAAGTA